MITKAQYAEMHDPPGGRLQLHHGEVVFFPYPKGQRTCAQVNLVDRIKPRALGRGKVIMELPFCPLPEHEVWAAEPGNQLSSSPAASNTQAEIADKRQTCFAGGCREFRLVDPEKRTVQTWAPDGATIKYSESASIPLTIMGAPPLPVSTIFEED
jgi:hypothetical protein